jgi:hypothetical protein
VNSTPQEPLEDPNVVPPGDPDQPAIDPTGPTSPGDPQDPDIPPDNPSGVRAEQSSP